MDSLIIKDIDFSMILAMLVVAEVLYVFLKLRCNGKIMNEDEVHHVGTHILILLGFVLTIVSYEILENAMPMSVWGIYALWHLHIENRKLTNGNYHA